MDTMPPPMTIPCIRVDGQGEQREAGHIEDLRWPSWNPQNQPQDFYGAQSQQPQPPFKLNTDVSNFTSDFYPQNQFNPVLNKFVEEQYVFSAVPQSAPVRDFSPFDTGAWIPEPASAITQYQDRLSSPDETVLSSASGSNYWPSSVFSSRFDGISCSPASQDVNMSRRGSAFESFSAGSEMQDPFAWSRNDAVYGMQHEAQPFNDAASMSGMSFTHPNMPASAQISRHPTPFNAMFGTEMDFEPHSRAASIPPSHRASSIPPQLHQHSASVPMQHSHSHSSLSATAANHFRYPSPHSSISLRQSLTPARDFESDFDTPLKSDDCDSDYIPGRRSRAHKPARSATHIRRPSYNAHTRSVSYNSACSPTAHRVSKRSHVRRPSSTSNIHYSPKHARAASSFHSSGVGLPIHPPSAAQPRPFSCPLGVYGCPKTFTSKNEWKRHVMTQHLLLGFWRCDLCPDISQRPNDFNRKDLFVQHLRRMHCGDRRGSTTVWESPDGVEDEGVLGESVESALERVRRRCWIQLRRPPRLLRCCFCAKEFEGEGKEGEEQERDRGCAVEWLEHVGRHLVAMTGVGAAGLVKSEEKKGHKRRKSGSNTSKSSVESAMDTSVKESELTEPPWASDQLLLNWLIEEGLVEQAVGRKGWVLVDRGVASEAAMTRRGRQLDDDQE